MFFSQGGQTILHGKAYADLVFQIQNHESESPRTYELISGTGRIHAIDDPEHRQRFEVDPPVEEIRWKENGIADRNPRNGIALLLGLKNQSSCCGE